MIDETLSRDTHLLGRFPHSTVLLHRNATVPWVILVPDGEATEFLDLAEPLRTSLLGEAARCATLIRAFFGSTKINFAAIGNVVPQLHLHVVGRTPDDTCWPLPVWGHLRAQREYPREMLDSIADAFESVPGFTRTADLH